MSRRINWFGVIGATAVFSGMLMLVFPEPPEKSPPVVPVPAQVKPEPLLAPQPPTPAWTLADVRQKARDRVRPHLERAEQQADAAVHKSLRGVDEFFDGVRQRTPSFAAEALGFHSKWRCLADHVPFAQGDHAQFLQARFREVLFTPDQLEQVVEQVIRSFLAELNEIDSRMLVEVGADLQDLPRVLPMHRVDQDQLQAMFKSALECANQDVTSDLQRDLGQAVVATVAGEVLSAVALRLGVSTTVLGAGAASGWFTVGVGVVVGAIIDEILNTAWDWWADPKGHLSADLNRRLQKMQKILLNGDKDQPGLKAHLQRLAQERLQQRRQALLGMIGQTGEGP